MGVEVDVSLREKENSRCHRRSGPNVRVKPGRADAAYCTPYDTRAPGHRMPREAAPVSVLRRRFKALSLTISNCLVSVAERHPFISTTSLHTSEPS